MSVVDATTVVEPFGGLFAEAVTGRAYLVTYNEDLWKSFDAEQQQFCKDTWLRKATPIPEVRYVVLKLVPDDLFPMFGHEKPYVEWQHAIDRPPECGFQVTTVVTVEVTTDSKYVDPVMRADISTQLAKPRYPAGATFRIVNKRGDLIEHGRL